MMASALFAGCTADFNQAMNHISDFTQNTENTKNAENAENAENTAQAAGTLSVFYLDVGQGDSEFIELPGGKTMLIDAGTSESGDYIIDFIHERGISKLDYVVATHPHADHIGGMADVLKAFSIGEIYMPDVTHDTKTFDRMLDAIEEKNITVKRAKAGISIFKDGSMNAELLAPCSDSYEELNDYSAVVKLNYGSTSFLFMGDAEELSENEIQGNVQCDVVKVGHHGSNTSSSPGFVSRTKAKYAVICAGRDNSYGLPKDKIISRWQNAGAEVLRTDIDGTISFTSDGRTVERSDF